MRFLAICSLLLGATAAANDEPPAPADPRSAYDFTLRAIDGRPYPLAQHRGQVLLIVNVASRCGFTPQYEGLQALYERYRERGLLVIGVPSNDFLWQEPGSNEEIAAFCRSTYGVSFPMMAKTAVTGRRINPLYRWLTAQPGFSGAISWNFNKFLIGRDGQVAARFGSRTAPLAAEVLRAVEAALNAAAP
ncbi:MAG: glutathione peroxidase [Planctomycetota bacterium]|nr:glutathione peroxidase [Planctomycetota bacterium]MDW8373745.1 glutathione peroxidase [Planctomycetota bacterium]